MSGSPRRAKGMTSSPVSEVSSSVGRSALARSVHGDDYALFDRNHAAIMRYNRCGYLECVQERTEHPGIEQVKESLRGAFDCFGTSPQPDVGGYEPSPGRPWKDRRWGDRVQEGLMDGPPRVERRGGSHPKDLGPSITVTETCVTFPHCRYSSK